MSNFEFLNFDSRNESIVSRLAKNEYPGVFADEPWNEWVRCNTETTPKKEVYWGKKSELNPCDRCPNCNSILSAYYEYDATYKKLMKEFNQPGLIALLGLKDQVIAGFGWSYIADSSQLIASKWEDATSKEMADIGRLIYSKLGVNRYRYIAEIGVLEEFRGQKLSNQIARGIITPGEQLVVRTNIDSWMVNVCENILGLEAIISPKLNNQDPVRPERVLYAGRASYQRRL